jgi:hypothetical protein
VEVVVDVILLDLAWLVGQVVEVLQTSALEVQAILQVPVHHKVILAAKHPTTIMVLVAEAGVVVLL